ncbi:hypothetical protein KP509_22G023000 [Ceratopteris richardii]|uniref:Calcium-transporting ATPase n=1 Tax=Ceratopteris richardii TaxID=49495 RepID=A0A8T2S5X2_CERRI|nr:hypothetical protein KP509_22G023000 [Ceratopteris richardii]KAH7306632.1 hypothetical protein KP509_22G023000 [Ceratopteris richardii]KAH7306633.1 hypothetical protein KP509_22G023000 [Ceratopteris richardii]KAH7306634.1 hypothetical protein KP509_22G023000 [Ceratopteris richardii]
MSSGSFLSDDHCTPNEFLSSKSSFQEPSSSKGTLEEDFGSAEDVFDIPSKGLSANRLQQWKKATLVLNAARRFRYTTNDSEELRKERLRRFWTGAQAVRAANRFLRAGAASSAQGYFDVEPVKLASVIQQQQVESLKELGGIKGILSVLRTNGNLGLNDNMQELETRRKVFGSNIYTTQPPKPFWAFVIDASKDLTLIILMFCAVLTLSLGMKTRGVKEGWYDGVSIAFAVIIVVVVTSVSDYKQSLQFTALNEEKKNIQVEVIRGGRRKEISIFHIVVGDIVLVKIGDQVPADGLLIDGHCLYVNQSSLTGESEPIHVHNKMPFLVSGSKVDDGQGTMVVTGVGMSTQWGQLMAAVGDDTAEETPLQVRLNGVATLIGKVGTTVAVLVFCILIIFYFVGHTEGPHNSGKFKAGQTPGSVVFDSVVQILETAVTIVVVAVPEGLPLAVTLSLAYAMKKMIADKALVRRLSACETMGCATTICSDKTGTLTLNQMTVVKAWLGGEFHDPVHDLHTVDKGYLQILYEGIVQNTSGSVFLSEEGGEPEVTGSPTEKAALNWGLKLDVDYAAIKSQSKILQVETFNSVKKCAGVAVRPMRGDKVHVHWKGAAEIILGKSDKLLYLDNKALPMPTDMRENLLNVIGIMASESLRCIAFAFVEMDASNVPDDEEIENWKLPEGPLTLLALIGIKDPIRPEVPDAVHQCQLAGIKVRMITGDNIITAKAIAAECGILQADDLAIDGETFRNYSPEERAHILPRISVVARSSPSDKLLMVSALRALGEVVAVTGDGTNDAPALREADIGLAMGIQGTEVAKESSDIVIMDDNFASVVRVVRWGRSVYRNIQKFIQFQLTVNVAALTINFVAAISAGDVPLTAIQLLWVNLIMDTLGALALATERPTDKLLEDPPVGRREPLISNPMWRNILSQAFFQITVLLIFQFRGKEILSLSGSKADDVNNTLIFNAFVFCQLFNEVNSRKIEEKNVFRGLLSNWLFLGIVGTTVVLQVIIVEFLNKFASTVKLEWKYWAISIVIGMISWIIGFFVKFVSVPKKQWIYSRGG